MTASYSDMYQLSQDPTFQSRVAAALLQTCANVVSENGAANPFSVPFHRERSLFVVQILNATATPSPSPYVQLFANSVATDGNVIADATQGGTVPLTPTNRQTQGALVTDVHIGNALAAQFNSYIRIPAN